MGLGDLIKSRRAEIGLTQIELANRANISQASINLYENDKRTPTSANMIKLAKALETSPEYLINYWEAAIECATTSEITSFKILEQLNMLTVDELRAVSQLIEILTSKRSVSI